MQCVHLYMWYMWCRVRFIHPKYDLIGFMWLGCCKERWRYDVFLPHMFPCQKCSETKNRQSCAGNDMLQLHKITVMCSTKVLQLWYSILLSPKRFTLTHINFMYCNWSIGNLERPYTSSILPMLQTSSMCCVTIVFLSAFHESLSEDDSFFD